MQTFRFTIRVCLVQKRGSVYAYGDQNPSKEVIPLDMGQGFSEERGSGGCCWGRFGVMPPVLGRFIRKDVVIEG